MKTLRRYLLDRMVLRPTRDPIDYAPQHRVLLRSGGHPLECFVQGDSADDRPLDVLILKFPGTAGRAERASDFPVALLPELNVKIWTWNPPGYGGSGGKASLNRIADAAIDFWEQVIARDADAGTAVLLCGNSLGCVTALHVAANVCTPPTGPRRDRSGMLLRNPPPLIPVVKRIASRYPMKRLTEPIADSLCPPMNAVETAQRVRMPAVFLQSELDTLVPPALQSHVIDAYAGQTRTVVMHGLSHGGLPDDSHHQAIGDAVDWLWNQIDSAPTRSQHEHNSTREDSRS